ncbi:hypothetical protein CWC15_10835 [Pseudoalteromonas spongiae]|nr:hypothetical protein CWC15_10835 [Pseudoalteromonas spongiae]
MNLALDTSITQRLPNLMLYEPIGVDERYLFIVHRLLRTLCVMAKDDVIEVQCVLTCPITNIPTVYVDVPRAMLNEVDTLFDETQRLLLVASRNQRL